MQGGRKRKEGSFIKQSHSSWSGGGDGQVGNGDEPTASKLMGSAFIRASLCEKSILKGRKNVVVSGCWKQRMLNIFFYHVRVWSVSLSTDCCGRQPGMVAINPARGKLNREI